MRGSFEKPNVDESENDGTGSFANPSSLTKQLTPEEYKQHLADTRLFGTLKDLPPTSFNTRRYIYEDTESFLFKGFVSENVVIGEARLSMKSISSGELFQIQTTIFPKMSIVDWKLECIAKTIWMWNGVNLLLNPNHYNEVKEFLKLLPTTYLDSLYKTYLYLFEKESKNQEYVEIFSLESYSRRMWKIYRKYPINSMAVTGIPGTDNLQINTVQKLWIMYNQIQDEIDEHMGRWDLVKANMSPHAGKQVKTLNTRDDAKRKEETKRKAATIDHFFYKKIGVLEDNEFVFQEALTRLKPVEELANEYKNWRDGIEDNHDKIVKHWKKIFSQKLLEQEERLSKAQEDTDIFDPEFFSTERPKIIAYTQQQLIDLGVMGKDRTMQHAVIGGANSSIDSHKAQYLKGTFKQDGVEVSSKNHIKNTLNKSVTMDDLNKLNNPDH